MAKRPSRDDGKQAVVLDAPRRSRLWKLLALTLVVKALVIFLGVLSLMIHRDQSVPFGSSWLTIWNQWDAPHYLEIARDGYVSEGEQARWIVFFPLYPWIVRITSWLFENPVVAAFVVSGIASVAAVWLLFELARLETNERIARNAVFFLLVFPTSYVLHIGYTESLFLALTLGSIVSARRGSWMLAGVLAGFASLARINGLVLIPTLAIEAALQYRSGQHRRISSFVWIVAGIAGFLIYLGINFRVFGDPFAFLGFQREFWHKSLAPPWVGIIGAWQSIFTRTPEQAAMVGVSEFGFALLGLGATIWSAYRLRATYAVWMAGNWLLLTSTSYLLSAPRYVLILFPMYVLFGLATEKHPVAGQAISILSILLLGLYISRFVQGAWAF